MLFLSSCFETETEKHDPNVSKQMVIADLCLEVSVYNATTSCGENGRLKSGKRLTSQFQVKSAR